MSYDPSLERQMLTYFGGQAAADFPTFSDFAESVGTPLAQLEQWRREIPAFGAVWEECRARQRSRLIRGALTRHFDPSFAKFLLCGELSTGEENTGDPFSLTVEVVD